MWILQIASMTIFTPLGGRTIDLTSVISVLFNVCSAATADSSAGKASSKSLRD